jgi:hypothetical protein
MNATAILALAVSIPVSALAQQRGDTMPQRAAGRTIIGMVTDSAERAIDSAEVFLTRVRRSTSADSAGRFRFDDVKPGEYQIAARRLGYYPQSRTVTVMKDSAVIVRFALVPHARGLPPVVSSARRGGLSGVVGDTAWAAIKDAQISVVSGTRRAISDSMGSFHIDLPPGRHMVRVTREGYAPQMVSATVPKDSGRRMMVFLRPSAVGETAIEQVSIMETEMRLARRSPAYSSIITREDINKGPWTELSQIAQSAASRPLPPDCLAWVDGGPKREYIWAIRASEIEMVEVYRTRAARRTVTSINGGGRRIGDTRPIFGVTPGLTTECPDEVYVWLRK